MREIDPTNPNLTYFANPEAAPSQEALDRLDAAVEADAIKRVTDKLMPGGLPIGKAGSGPRVRELSGGPEAARDLFEDLSVGGKLIIDSADLKVTQLPGRAGYLISRFAPRRRAVRRRSTLMS